MKSKKLPFDRAMGAPSSIREPHWRATALALATAVLLGTAAPGAHALALGRLTVQSALGDPLRAEIDIPEITSEEIASLRASVATPEAFRAAGVEFNPALADLRITLERRADGRHFLRLASSRPVNDPFLDLILESSWATGRVVRDYTMLFDPPSMRANQQPLTAQTAPAQQVARSAPAAAAPGRAAPRNTTPAPSASAAPAAPAPSAAPAPRTATAGTPGAAPAPRDAKQVTVQAGDTAGRLAATHKAPTVSLDQMLVALLRANPDAFIGGNINRLRAGAVLEVPGSEEAAMVPPDDARQTLVAQSRDFNEFRRRLAEGVPETRVSPAERQSAGKVTAEVEEKRPAATAPDKLTLSKGGAQGTSGTEDKIAQQRAAQDAATRVAELNKNIADLNRLGTPVAPATATASSGAKPGIPVPLGTPGSIAARSASAPAAVAPAAPAVAAAQAASATPATASASAAAAALNPAAASVSASAPAPVASASAAAPMSAATSAPVAAAVAPKPAAATPAPSQPAETSFIDDLLANPLVLGAGALIALLAGGFGFYRVLQRRKVAQVDSSFLESRLQPDSFFGASGGQRIDTNEGSVTGSSMVYSPSQLDAAGDVDPVAEADVYLAYGRDLQAEEILKEALRTQPHRVAIHAKLLEIYAKRRDAKAFELIATEAFGITNGHGPEWEHICELGRELDASNPMYRPGGQPTEGAAAAVAAAAAGFGAAGAGAFGATTQTQAVPEHAAAQPDIDLDLDFSLGDDEPAPPVAPQPEMHERTQAVQASPAMPSLDMDFNLPDVAAPEPAPVSASAPAVATFQPAATLDAPDLVLDENSLSFDLTPPPAQESASAPAAAAPAPAHDDGMLEFDLGSLSLDLPGSKTEAHADADADAGTGPDTETPTTAGAPLSTGFAETGSDDPLATKLALAQEFNAIGDPDGARTLAQEVIAEASGDLKSAAQKFLAEIG